MPFALLFLLALMPADDEVKIPGLPPQMQQQFAHGLEAQKAGNLDEAEKLFKALVAQGVKSAPVHNALGNVYQMKGEHKQALAAFGASERLDPKDPVHHSLIGVSLLALGRPREATREFRLAVQMQPDSLLFREQLAGAYARLDNYPAAIDQYSKLLELKADSTEYLYQLGHTYLVYSASCFERIKDLNAGSARLYQVMGDQYLVQGKVDKAIESYEKAGGTDPTIPEIEFLLGQLYLKQGDREKALQALNRALALMPNSPPVLALKNAVLEGMKCYERAVSLNRKRLPASPWPPLNYGMLLLRQGSLDQAETLLREAVNLGPGMPLTHHQLGVVLAKQKKPSEAVDELKKAVELDPTYPEAHFTLAYAYRQLGDRKRADLELDAFQKLKQSQKDRDNAAGSGPANDRPR